ncbi:MAG: hypothetical protein M1823_001869 [Watsoniomyces obsoletus]|nr:MAG: hypothetical protein M1823_001869 [Watsoniomyces obsoletus]
MKEIQHDEGGPNAEDEANVWEFAQHVENTEAGSTVCSSALQERRKAYVGDQRRLTKLSKENERAIVEAAAARDSLKEAWASFLDKLEAEESHSKSHFWSRKRPQTTAQLLQSLEASTLKDLTDAVDEARSKWQENKRLADGKAQKLFHKTCETLDSHRGMFKMFPSEDKYVTVLSGSLQMLVKASVNHVDYGERLSDKLEEISARMELATSPIMHRVTGSYDMLKGYVASLYAAFFGFLRQAMTWYTSGTWKRIRTSFNENIIKQLDRGVELIRIRSDRIINIAKTRGLADGWETRQMVEDTNMAVYETREIVHQLLANQQQTWQNAPTGRVEHQDPQVADYIRRIGDAVFTQLTQHSRDDRTKQILLQHIEDASKPELIRKLSTTIVNAIVQQDQAKQSSKEEQSLLLQQPSTSDQEKVTPSISVDDVLGLLERLDRYIIGEPGASFIQKHPTGSASEAVLSKLREWSTASTSQLLWLACPQELVVPSALSAVAGSLILSSMSLDIPTISHICNRGPYQTSMSGSDESPEEAGLIGLVYSLIRQMLVIVVNQVQGSDQELVRFHHQLAQLDGSMRTWNIAMQLLSGLFGTSPPLMLCVIDGLNILDYGSAAARCYEFLEKFWEPFTRPNKVLKVLHTTSGHSKNMMHQIPRDFIHMVEPSKKQRRFSDQIDGDSPLGLLGQYPQQPMTLTGSPLAKPSKVPDEDGSRGGP